VSVRMEDLGELGYGGLVTLTEWWDDQRIADGKLTEKDFFKKASTYGYLVPGGICLVTSAFDLARPIKPWDEHISHGFIYDFPRFIRKAVKSFSEEGTAKSAAVREAQRIARLHQETGRKQITQRSTTGRYPSPPYQPEFQGVRLVG
jgi:hypothetical protein